MAGSGDVLTFAEFEANANRLAHLYRSVGLRRGDHVAIFMENNLRYFETMSAAERSGLYYTCINSYLTPEEVAYIVDNCDARLLDRVGGHGRDRRGRRGHDPEGGDVPVRGRRHRDRPLPSLRRGGRRVPGRRRSPTSSSARRCSTRRARPAGRRGSCGPCPTPTRASRWPCSSFITTMFRFREGMRVPVAGADLPLGPAGVGVLRTAPRRHVGDHGALRPRAVPRAGRTPPDHPLPGRARRCSAGC